MRRTSSSTARAAAAISTGASLSRADVTAYTDGACLGNPGPGGWAAIITDDGAEREISGSEVRTTNQRMELMAALEALRAIPGRRRVHVYSDSAYLVNCFLDRWHERWVRSGWKNAGKQ